MLTQRVDECKQSNLNNLLDFKQSLIVRLEKNEKRERNEFNNVCKTLNELTVQLRENELHTEAVIDRVKCFESRYIDGSESLCLSQSFKDRRALGDFAMDNSIKNSSSMERSIVFRKE
jgi:hypothetical protein